MATTAQPTTVIKLSKPAEFTASNGSKVLLATGTKVMYGQRSVPQGVEHTATWIRGDGVTFKNVQLVRQTTMHDQCNHNHNHNHNSTKEQPMSTTTTTTTNNSTTTTTYRNNRTNRTLTTTLSKRQILDRFLEHADDEHWLWYWLANFANDTVEANTDVKDMVRFLADSFLFACGMGLKRPMIRVSYKDRRYKLYLSQRGNVCIKGGDLIPGTSDPIGNETYVGCFARGKFWGPSVEYGSDVKRPLTEAEQEFIDRLLDDPVGFLAQCSKDMDRCCYCNLPLEDAHSKEVGYGPICAQRYGLPWGKTYDENVPSFAQVWAESADVRNMMEACRHNPQSEDHWAILGDALEDSACLKKPKPPHPDSIIAKV